MRRHLLSILALAPFALCGTVEAQTRAGSGYAATGKPRAAVRYMGRRAAGRLAAARTTTGAGQYFVEFRSRHALSYGHTFLVHGRLNGRGEVGPLSAANVAGFHPAGAGPELWTLGHVVPVVAETGPSDGDLEEEYVSARYRVVLSEAEYRRVAAYIRQKQQNSGAWHATLNNCNTWVGQVAAFMGLRAPFNHVMYPANYINELRRLNAEGAVEPPART